VTLTRSARLFGGSAFLFVLLGLAVSCTSLEDIELGVCGNRVLDPGEDCDGHELHGVACAEPGSLHACRYVCDFASAEPSCPDADYRCGAANVCARAGRGLVRGVDLELGGDAVVVADFDGDKIDDIGVANAAARELVVSFLGAGSSIELSQRIPIDSTIVAAAELNDDGRADLIVSSDGSLVTLSSSSADRSLVGNASAFISVGSTRLIGVPARALPGDALEPDTVMGGVLVGNEIFFQNPFTFIPQLVASIGEPVVSEDLVGFFKSRFYPVPDGKDPCDEIIVVRSDSETLTVVQMCVNGEPALENPACALDACIQSLVLQAKPVAAFALNLDDDPESEIVVVERNGADFTLETIDGGLLEPGPAAIEAQEWLSALVGSDVPAGPPILAIAFLNDDLDPDFVRSDGVYLSKRLFADPLVAPSYFQAAVPSANDWVEAVVGDFGGDPRLDVVASSGQRGDDLDLRIGSTGSYLNAVSIAVGGAAAKLTPGDYDGDGVSDLIFRERPSGEAGPLPSCEIIDSLVVRFGARDEAVLADARVLSRVSGVEDLVAGFLPRFDTRDSISDFATGTRCFVEGEPAPPIDITLFYGAVNRQVAAPKVLIDNRDVDNADQVLVPYTPEVVTTFSTGSVVAALGDDRFKELATETEDDVALFVLETSNQGPLAEQHISLLGNADANHTGMSSADFRVAVIQLPGSEQPTVAVVDSFHIHLIQAWADLPEASDKDAAKTLESFASLEVPGGEGFKVEVALGGDVTGDGQDDLIVAGRLDGAPVLRIYADIGNPDAQAAAVFDDSLESEAIGAAVVGVALLPRDDLPGAETDARPVDLVLALDGKGAIIVRYEGGTFRILESLALDQTTTVGVGDVDGDQFADVVLVAPDRVSVFLRAQRFAGDAPVSVEEGAN